MIRSSRSISKTPSWSFGVKTVRTAAKRGQGARTDRRSAPEFALLDVSLIREKSFAVAERLDALKIPFAFVTGYGADTLLPAAFASKPRLPKPYSTDALAGVVEKRRLQALSGCFQPGQFAAAATAALYSAWDRASSTTARHRRGRAT
jgi:DNA-binding LytR/AlgR family response regulator